jgi:hypothetical protein
MILTLHVTRLGAPRYVYNELRNGCTCGLCVCCATFPALYGDPHINLESGPRLAMNWLHRHHHRCLRQR